MNTVNRRAVPRIKAKRGHYASYPGGVAAIRDISLGGVMLEDRDPIPTGNRMLLELHLGPELVTCTGVVKRSSVFDGTAVQFLEMSAGARKLLGGYLMQIGLADNRRRLNEGVKSAAGEYRASNPPPPEGAIREVQPGAPRLGELLVRRGLITQGQLAAAIAEQRVHRERLCSMLIRLGILTEDEVLDFFCREFRLPAVDLTTVDPTSDALAQVPHALARAQLILPIGISGGTLTVAVGDPSNLDGLNEVRFRSDRTLRISLAPLRALEDAIDHAYAMRARAAG